MSIAKESAAWEEDSLLRELPRALQEGRPAMVKDALSAKKWMWPLPLEMEIKESGGEKATSRYRWRVQAAVLQNEWFYTLRRTASLPYRTDIKVAGWGKALEAAVSTIFQGRNLTTFAENQFLEKLVAGITFGQADLPTKEEVPDASKRWPYLIALPPEAIIEAEIGIYGGVMRPLQIRVKDVAAPDTKRDRRIANPEDYESFVEVEQVRHYIAGDPSAGARSEDYKAQVATFQLITGEKVVEWEMTEDYRPLEPKRGAISEIPIVPYPTDFTANPWRSPPPFLDSAYLQAAHWRTMSRLDRAEEIAVEVPLILTGVSGMSEVSDQGSVIAIASPEAKPYQFEAQGYAMEKLMARAEALIYAIKILNLEPVLAFPEGGSQRITAAEVDMKSVLARSPLEAWVLYDQAATAKLLGFWNQLAGIPDRGTVDTAHDFALSEPALRRMVEMGTARRPLIDPYTVLDVMQRAGEIPADLDIESVAERVGKTWARATSRPKPEETDPAEGLEFGPHPTRDEHKGSER